MFVLDEHRNAAIAARKGVEVASDAFTLNGSYRFTQAQNDAVLALHAMETAAYSLGLGCVILGSLLNDVPALIDLLNLPEYTYPVLGIATRKPDQEPAVKPRVCRVPCSSSRTSIQVAMRSCCPAWICSTSKYTSITICAILNGRWTRSATRLRQMRSTRAERQGRCRAGEATGLPFGAVDRCGSARIIDTKLIQHKARWIAMNPPGLGFICCLVLGIVLLCPAIALLLPSAGCSPSCGNVA